LFIFIYFYFFLFFRVAVSAVVALPSSQRSVVRVTAVLEIKMYTVAQNKIPHQTICNIFATSGQILKIFEAV